MLNDLKSIVEKRMRLTSKQRRNDGHAIDNYYIGKMNAYRDVLNIIDVLKRNNPEPKMHENAKDRHQTTKTRRDQI